MKINYDVKNQNLAALFVAADTCLQSFGKAVLRNCLEYQRFLINYQGLHPDKREKLTNAFDTFLDRVLDQVRGISVEEWGGLRADIHISDELVTVDAGLFRLEIWYEKKKYRAKYTAVRVREPRKTPARKRVPARAA